MSARRTAATARAAGPAGGGPRAIRVKARRHAATAALSLAAYLTVFVTAPAWHDHGTHVGCEAGCPASSQTAGCGAQCPRLDRHEHAHPGHEREGCRLAASETAGETEERAPGSPPVGHDCDLCDLIAQCPLPVAPPALMTLSEPLPATAAVGDESAEVAFLRTRTARGPPRA